MIALRNNFVVAVQIIRERVDFGFQNVADHREPAIRVAIKRAIAEREFRFVSGRKQQTAFGVRDRHQDVAAQVATEDSLPRANCCPATVPAVSTA